MANINFVALVREFYPDATDEQALDILWNYTGFPSFWHNDPAETCRAQLAHLKAVGPQVVDAELDAMMEAV